MKTMQHVLTTQRLARRSVSPRPPPPRRPAPASMPSRPPAAAAPTPQRPQLRSRCHDLPVRLPGTPAPFPHGRPGDGPRRPALRRLPLPGLPARPRPRRPPPERGMTAGRSDLRTSPAGPSDKPHLDRRPVPPRCSSEHPVRAGDDATDPLAAKTGGRDPGQLCHLIAGQLVSHGAAVGTRNTVSPQLQWTPPKPFTNPAQSTKVPWLRSTKSGTEIPENPLQGPPSLQDRVPEVAQRSPGPKSRRTLICFRSGEYTGLVAQRSPGPKSRRTLRTIESMQHLRKPLNEVRDRNPGEPCLEEGNIRRLREPLNEVRDRNPGEPRHQPAPTGTSDGPLNEVRDRNPGEPRA